MSKKYLIISLLLLCGCAARSNNNPDTVVSMQIVDRNGFSETISSKDRLSNYKNTDFLHPQTYQKVLRVFGKDTYGRSSSKITTYHDNGQICQYLEIVEGRARGKYKEWHPNGKPRISAYVIEGQADIHELAQASWVFEGQSEVWDESGQLIADIWYEKGQLEKTARYYHPSGKLWKLVPYERNEIHGTLSAYDSDGNLIEKGDYAQGLKHGAYLHYWAPDSIAGEETYEGGLLKQGAYFDKTGATIGAVDKGEGMQAVFADGALISTIEHHKGVPDGQVQLFDYDGSVNALYRIKDDKKSGEELSFYPLSDKPKISLFWHEDVLQGTVKTWYENGVMESQREMSSNKKHGLSFAWFKDGNLMLMEEYENDILVKGAYYKKGDKSPISKVENGQGAATLYDGEGHFIKKIAYEKGKPLLT